MRGNKTLVNQNGPSLLEVNLGLEIHHFKFLASSHILSPFLNGVNPHHP